MLQVVALDARNHGDSDHHPVMDYLTMRDDLLGVMDKLKVEKSVLLGHSMGGKTVMTYALSRVRMTMSAYTKIICPCTTRQAQY
jgi:esterase